MSQLVSVSIQRALYLFLLSHTLSPAFSQTACNNVNFELGNTLGWQGYTGYIDKDGTVVIEEFGFSKEQHKITELDDGYDPIAREHCERWDTIRMVALGGNHSLRLGNESIGAKAERIVKNFEVTPDNSAFIFQYAVILNDPEHEHFEQPRFELRVFDENGELYPCGEYQVRAAEFIEGFESCEEGWRVRPWTTVGIALNEYIGKEVTVEFITTDCAQGGHAGYAYVDAACHPFQITRDEFCEGVTSLMMEVPPGFASYRWSTGDTSRMIQVEEPQEGQVFSVELTSLTGCVFNLQDSLPFLNPPPIVELDSLQTPSICEGESYELLVQGQYIDQIYWPQLEQNGHRIMVTPTATTTYYFEASNKDACETISDSITIEVLPLPNLAPFSRDTSVCKGDTVTVTIEGDYDGIVEWENIRSDSSSLSFIADSTITLHYTISGSTVCTYTDSILVRVIDPGEVYFTVDDQAICEGESITLSVIGTHQGTVYWPELQRNDFDLTVSPDTTTVYTYQVLDVSGCATFESEVLVDVTQLPDIQWESPRCEREAFWLNATWAGATYEWQDGSSNSQFYVQKSGTYNVTITNACGSSTATVDVQVAEFNNGCDIQIPTAFSPNDDGINDRIEAITDCIDNELINYEFKIYDRWGQLIFKTNDLQKSWDGYFRGTPAPMGVYVWFLDYDNPICGKQLRRKGNLTVIR